MIILFTSHVVMMWLFYCYYDSVVLDLKKSTCRVVICFIDLQS